MPYWIIPVGVLCVLAALALRLVNVVRELTCRHQELTVADKQLALYTIQSAGMRDGPEARQALERAALSRSIYQSVAAEYNRCISKPGNRPIAQFLHYRPVSLLKEDV